MSEFIKYNGLEADLRFPGVYWIAGGSDVMELMDQVNGPIAFEIGFGNYPVRPWKISPDKSWFMFESDSRSYRSARILLDDYWEGYRAYFEHKPVILV